MRPRSCLRGTLKSSTFGKDIPGFPPDCNCSSSFRGECTHELDRCAAFGRARRVLNYRKSLHAIDTCGIEPAAGNFREFHRGETHLWKKKKDTRTPFYQITTNIKVSKFFIGKHPATGHGTCACAKYVYVFGNDCTFVITAVGALFSLSLSLFLLLNGISQREIRFERMQREEEGTVQKTHAEWRNETRNFKVTARARARACARTSLLPGPSRAY